MSYESPANQAGNTAESATITRQRRVIFSQRVSIALLLAATMGALLTARAERSRAELLQADAMLLQTRVQLAEPAAEPAATATIDVEALKRNVIPESEIVRTDGASMSVGTGRDPFVNTSRYNVKLIADDGSEQALTGKALSFDMGGRGLTIDLTKRPKGYLLMYAPIHRDDKEGRRIVLHPACSNVLQLELSPFSMKGDSDADGDALQFTGADDSIHWEKSSSSGDRAVGLKE